MADRESEKVDDLVHMGSNKVCPKDTICPFLDESFVTIDGLGRLKRGEPTRRPFTFQFEVKPCLARLGLARSYRSNGRYGEGDARHPTIVRLHVVAVDEVRRDNFAVVAGNRRERRSMLSRVTGRIDGGVADALKELVEF